MKTIFSSLLISLALTATVSAQQKAVDHAAHHPASAASPAAAADMTEGEVRKVDKDAAKLTLKHGEIRNLDMPAMTMVFAVSDKALLDKLKAGDKVRFRAIDAAGTLTVTEIQPAR